MMMVRRRKPLLRKVDWSSRKIDNDEPFVIYQSGEMIWSNIEAQITTRMRGNDSIDHLIFEDRLSSMIASRNIDGIVEVCRPYLKIEIRRSHNETKVCISCNIPIVHDADEKSVELCEECGEVSIVPGIKLDDTRDYDSLKTFQQALDNFVCIRAKETNLVQMQEILDNYFRLRKLKTCEQVRALPLNSKGQRGTYKIADLRMALRVCKFASHYVNIYYIAHKLWAWETPRDIIRKRQMIIDMYRITQSYVTKFGHIGIQLRLCKLIMLASDKYDESDFIIPESENSRVIQEDCWKRTCDAISETHPHIYYQR